LNLHIVVFHDVLEPIVYCRSFGGKTPGHFTLAVIDSITNNRSLQELLFFAAVIAAAKYWLQIEPNVQVVF
jgi:hypothetical protein